METVRQLWIDFQALPFPHEIKAHSDVYTDMARLNQAARQGVQDFVDADGQPGAETMQVLKNCLTDMQTSNPGLTGDAQVYFGLLYRICDLIVNEKLNA